METRDAAIILAKCAAFDSRTIGRADAEAWADALTRSGVTPDEALNAVGSWYAEHRERIMPADVSQLARDARRKRSAEVGYPDYPSGLTQIEERQWARRWHQLINEGCAPNDAAANCDAFFGIVQPALAPADPARMRALAAGVFQ